MNNLKDTIKEHAAVIVADEIVKQCLHQILKGGIETSPDELAQLWKESYIQAFYNLSNPEEEE